MKKLTDKEYWESYWNNFEPSIVTSQILFDEFLLKLPDKELDSIEIGGFPGTYSIYLKKFKNYKVSLIDYYIDKNILSKMLKINSLNENDINIITGDIFNYSPEKKYEFVFSSGFIEHFDNTEHIIQKHLELLSPKGLFFISLPNLRGILGLITKYLDPNAYYTHNIKSMKINSLQKIMKNTQCAEYKIFYYGNPYLYINKNATVHKNTRSLISLL